MAGEDDIVWPLTGNDNLTAVGLAPENDNDTCEDTAVLFGIDVGSGSTPIDLDGGGGEGATRLGLRSAPTAQLPQLLVPLLLLVSVNLLCGLILIRSMRL
jgi:hypothetical protein